MSSNVQGAAQRGTPSDSQEHERAGHTSLYERAFGRGSAEFPADCMSAPLYEHGGGGSMDEQDTEEMLYQRSLVMEHYRKATAQDHAWSGPAFPAPSASALAPARAQLARTRGTRAHEQRSSFAFVFVKLKRARCGHSFAYNAQMGGKPFHCGPPEYAMHPQMHQHAIMAHAAASRRSMGDVSDMAHKRGAYGYEMPPYGVMPRRMMFYGDSQGAFHAHQAEMGMYHMAGGVQRRANVPAYPTGMQTPSIDVDACARGRRGMLKGSEMKKELVIFPRRKAGQSKRQADNEAPVRARPPVHVKYTYHAPTRGTQARRCERRAWVWVHASSVSSLSLPPAPSHTYTSSLPPLLPPSLSPLVCALSILSFARARAVLSPSYLRE